MMMQVLRAPAIARYAVRNNSMRNFSTVQKLADSNAVEDFRNLNSKAVMYFTASWCGPCKAISPMYQEMATKYTDIAFGKVDIDENADSSMEYEISAVPTFIFFEDNKAVALVRGADVKGLQSNLDLLQNSK
ncbi:hypothetical protein FisN_3Hh030 [Fistulifera solaris]|uniref:Thioredoxin domain-containing protein n=1 Tax=Fistulifera solaris TaxID=1519565 RepID=A0A1Z5JNF9_FISSO|nr:hypothetical protein FisN_3Hh030 [Fistulifera solaris]|eukprot:GAX15563.1 hypothetical protein FisN_3Hh030 [Fistulifera solaris]